MEEEEAVLAAWRSFGLLGGACALAALAACRDHASTTGGTSSAAGASSTDGASVALGTGVAADDDAGAIEGLASAGPAGTRTRGRPIVGLDGSYNAPSPAPTSGSRIASSSLETRVYAGPDRHTGLIGSLRAGSIVSAAEGTVAGPGCAAGYAKITSPVPNGGSATGYVCMDAEATRDLTNPIVRASSLPDLSQKLPYIYGTVKRGGPYYSRIPDDASVVKYEPNLATHLARWKKDKDWGATYGLDLWTRKKTQKAPDALAAYSERTTDADLPDFLASSEPLPTLSGRRTSLLKVGEVSTHNGIAFFDTYLVRGRRWGLTADLRVMPTDRLRAIRGSEFHGVQIGDEVKVPFAITRHKPAKRFRHEGHKFVPYKTLEAREVVSLTGQLHVSGDTYFHETKDGDWVDDHTVSIVEPIKHVPQWGAKGEKWLEINVTKQLLIAYEGDTAVYATLVSTGEAGLGDPETTKSTRLGIFRIHTKYVTATMDSKTVGEEFELRDVPYVQYFQDGYALHAAYWHDVFGMPKSHGCVNLAPEDARRLFSWTDPQVPDGWHSARKSLTGTVVFIHR